MGGMYGPYALAGVLLMVALWPTERSGRRLLRRWGGPAEPAADQTAAAVRYLRDRRLLILPLLLLAPLTSGAEDAISNPFVPGWGGLHLIASILVALLIADTAGGLRPSPGSVRSALLVRRRWPDLLPRRMLRLYLGLTGMVLVVAAAVLAAQRWVGGALDRYYRERRPVVHLSDQAQATVGSLIAWWLIAGAVLGLLLVYGTVRLAATRPAAADGQVDLALRTRSARVAVGLGLVWSAWLAVAGMMRLDRLSVLVDDVVPEPAWFQAVTRSGVILALPTVLVAAWAWGWWSTSATTPSRRIAQARA